MDGNLISHGGRIGDVKALMKVSAQILSQPAENPSPESLAARRQLLAEFCKIQAKRLGKPAMPVLLAGPKHLASLSPRLKQTLQHLLLGDGEKQIAAKLNISPHTVHVNVKELHKRFRVSSRSELLSHFISLGRSADELKASFT